MLWLLASPGSLLFSVGKLVDTILPKSSIALLDISSFHIDQ